MGFDFSSALEGGMQGATTAAPTGNPYAIAGAAALQALISGFKKKKSGDAASGSGGMLSGLMGGDKSGDDQGFLNPDVIGKALDIFGGMTGGSGSSEAPEEKVIQTPKSAIQGPTLLGFPSLALPGISDKLKNAIAARRGF